MIPSLQRIFLEMVTKGVVNKKLVPPKKDNLSYFVKDITEIIGYLSSEHPDVVALGTSCISKFINALGTYEFQDKPKAEIYKLVIQALQEKFDIKHILPMLSNSLVDSISIRKTQEYP
jgi:hypothetical protein